MNVRVCVLPILWSESLTCFGKSVKVLTREFSTFAIQSFQKKNKYTATGKLSLMTYI